MRNTFSKEYSNIYDQLVVFQNREIDGNLSDDLHLLQTLKDLSKIIINQTLEDTKTLSDSTKEVETMRLDVENSFASLDKIANETHILNTTGEYCLPVQVSEKKPINEEMNDEFVKQVIMKNMGDFERSFITKDVTWNNISSPYQFEEIFVESRDLFSDHYIPPIIGSEEFFSDKIFHMLSDTLTNIHDQPTISQTDINSKKHIEKSIEQESEFRSELQNIEFEKVTKYETEKNISNSSLKIDPLSMKISPKAVDIYSLKNRTEKSMDLIKSPSIDNFQPNYLAKKLDISKLKHDNSCADASEQSAIKGIKNSPDEIFEDTTSHKKIDEIYIRPKIKSLFDSDDDEFDDLTQKQENLANPTPFLMDTFNEESNDSKINIPEFSFSLKPDSTKNSFVDKYLERDLNIVKQNAQTNLSFFDDDDDDDFFVNSKKKIKKHTAQIQKDAVFKY